MCGIQQDEIHKNYGACFNRDPNYTRKYTILFGEFPVQVTIMNNSKAAQALLLSTRA
jgi:hypothetical protein